MNHTNTLVGASTVRIQKLLTIDSKKDHLQDFMDIELNSFIERTIGTPTNNTRAIDNINYNHKLIKFCQLLKVMIRLLDDEVNCVNKRFGNPSSLERFHQKYINNFIDKNFAKDDRERINYAISGLLNRFAPSPLDSPNEDITSNEKFYNSLRIFIEHRNKSESYQYFRKYSPRQSFTDSADQILTKLASKIEESKSKMAEFARQKINESYNDVADNHKPTFSYALNCLKERTHWIERNLHQKINQCLLILNPESNRGVKRSGTASSSKN